MEGELTPPHAFGAEKSVLSTILRDPTRLDEVCHLTTEHFYLPGHAKLFAFLCELRDKGEAIELVSLSQRLHEAGLLDPIGGVSGLSEIYTYAPSSAHFGKHAALLREKHALRGAQRLAGAVLEAVESQDPQTVLQALGEPVSALIDEMVGNRQSLDFKALLQNEMTRWKALLSGEKPPRGVQTSLGEFNQRIGGLNAGHTVIVSGFPETGKSLLAMQLGLDACLDDHPLLFLTLEMSADQLARRCIAYASRVPGKAITDPKEYFNEEWGSSAPSKEWLTTFQRNLKALGAGPIAVEHLTGPNVAQLSAIIRRHHRKRPLRVVVLDYIQRCRARPGHDRDSFERILADCAESLADLARELGLTLILTSQLSKDGAAKHAEAINEAGDVHLQIRINKETKEHRGVFIEKDRHGGQSGKTLQIVLDKEMQRFAFAEIKDEKENSPNRWKND